jgi:hypothetical protein
MPLTHIKTLARPPYRTLAAMALLTLLCAAGYAVWSPGRDVRDGRHDRGRNAVWLQHGWLGDDGWFERNGKRDRITHFRNPDTIRVLSDRLRTHRITDLFPHLCPSDPDGRIPPIDAPQAGQFLHEFRTFRVMPWIGGILNSSAFPDDARWRKAFATSARDLLTAHPGFAGVHINIEPCPSGNTGFLALLDDLRASLPPGKALSVAAYPPPTRWHPHPEVHWDEAYYREVARRADQLAVMMYDTSLRLEKPYRHLMASWTNEALDWSAPSQVLLGLPAYDDAGSGYHHPDVENLRSGLSGIHAGLARRDPLPANYQGIAIYSEWEMDESEWNVLRDGFVQPASPKER